jgi:hypothetical protein
VTRKTEVELPEYDELKLRIQRRDDDAYRVVAFGPGNSTATWTFSLPFTATELDNFVLRVGRPRRGVRAYRSSQMEEAKRFGAQLFDTLIGGDVRDVYREARSFAEARNRGLRVTLSLTDVPELTGVPWEFVYERPSFLSQSIYTPVVRSLDLRSVRRPRRVTLPLHVLGMASGPEGLDELDVGREQQKLANALKPLRDRGLVELEWLDRATLARLDEVINRPDEVHILHYVGHGAYDERSAAGILVFESERGAAHEVTGEELGSLLQDERSLQLVVLNSCEGARSSHVDPFSGVASSLLEYGIPAVIGMQFEITDEAAITFAGRLYAAIAQGYGVDAALAHARKAIFAAGRDVEFGTPVLFLRAADARLFEFEPRSDEASTDRRPEARPEPPPAPSKRDLALVLTQRPERAAAGARITWELKIDNVGDRELIDVTAWDANGESLGEAVGLQPAGRHTVQWSEILDPADWQVITVTARDSAGEEIFRQTSATPKFLEQPAKRPAQRAESRPPAPAIGFRSAESTPVSRAVQVTLPTGYSVTVKVLSKPLSHVLIVDGVELAVVSLRHVIWRADALQKQEVVVHDKPHVRAYLDMTQAAGYHLRWEFPIDRGGTTYAFQATLSCEGKLYKDHITALRLEVDGTTFSG